VKSVVERSKKPASGGAPAPDAPEITRLTEAFLHQPVRIEVARAASTAATITQALVASAPGPGKRQTLRNLIRSAEPFKNAIIFCNRKRDVALLHKSLLKHGFNAGALHGDMDQRARMASLEAFKTGEVDLIVCSDVAARGLDIPDVSHVFNFDIPVHAEDYVHRIGRTGRAGKAGTALTIVSTIDKKHVAEIEKLIAQPIPWLDGADFKSLVQADGEAAAAPEADGEVAGKHLPPRMARGRRSRRGEGDRPERAAAPVREVSRAPEPEAPHETPRAPRKPVAAAATPRGRSYSEPEDNNPVVGMGDHTPMFLLRPVRLKPAKITEDQE